MKTMALAVRLLAIASLIATARGTATAQQDASGGSDTLRLPALHQRAVSSDPRQRQFELLEQQTQLRLKNLSSERLPAFAVEAQAQYQSDVFTAPFSLPGGAQFPSPSKDSYDGRLTIEQPILDPTISPRQQEERAVLAESNARVQTELYGLRREVNDAFFSAALLAERSGVIAITIADLEQRLQESRIRVREGAALPGDTAAIQATLLQRRQDQVELAADRQAAFVRLAELIRQPIAGDAIALPDLSAEIAEARAELPSLRSRPEFQEFARARDRLKVQEDVVQAEGRPQVSAFGRLGYGKPGLNAVNDSFDAYYVFGVQIRFAPFNWGSTGRERQALALQREIVASDEAAFASGLTRDIQNDLATIDRLDTTLVMDDAIVLLRERVESETRLRFQEGVVTASEYLDRSTDVLEARLARATHRVEQAQARASFLTTLGLEIR